MNEKFQDIIKRLRENDETLTSIDLSFNNLRIEEIRALAEALKINTKLTSINLIYTNIGTGGAEALAEALQDSAITSINLSANNIGH